MSDLQTAADSARSVPIDAVRDGELAASPSTGATRISGIDGLRAAAILIVMASHAGLGRIVPGGFGVTVFFFLSGYLITTLLRLEYSRTGHIDLLAFYGRRIARILPPLYLTLTLVLGLVTLGWLRAAPTPAGLALDLLFLTNYAGLFGVEPTVPIPLWSLDVEEHFYLIFPALFIVLARARVRRPQLLLAAACVAVLLLRCATFPTDAQWHIYYWSHTRIDSIVFGAILAMWRNPVVDANVRPPRPLTNAAAVLVLLLTFTIRDPLFRETVRYSAQGVALFVLFSAAIQAHGPVALILNSAPLRLVAILSYTLYLVHFPLLAVLEQVLPIPLAVTSAYLLAFAWAGLMYVGVERPLARWRKRSLANAMDQRRRRDLKIRTAPLP